MLRAVMFDVHDNEVTVQSIDSMTLCRDSDTPCDSLSMVVSEAYSDEIVKVFLYDGENQVYEGIVDEQIMCVSDEDKTEIISRSLTALLVDNEACPETFNYPDTETLFRRYLKPLGFESYRGENRVYDGVLKVSKGMSCYGVLEDFSKETYGVLPVAKGSTVVLEEEEKEPLRFCDDSDGKGVIYSMLEYTQRRCVPVSHLWVRTENSGGYDTLITDAETVNRGIRRQRYLNASVPSEVPFSKADEILKSAKEKSRSITLWCPEALTDILGRRAEIKGRAGSFSGYRVSSLRYVMKNSKEETRIVLRREE